MNRKEIELLENELETKIYPGTEVLRDTTAVHFATGSAGVLVPQPSNDPNDPLNWSKRYKAGCIVSAVLIGFSQGFAPLALASQIPYYIGEFDIDVEAVLNFIGVTILVLGFSNFFWVPVATQFGRRPAAILSRIVSMGSMIWKAKATTSSSFLGACILNGIGSGPAETLPPMIIADIMFLQDRGMYMGLYWWSYFGAIIAAPIISGSISEALGWRSFWWLNTIMFGIIIILLLFLLPETKFVREESIEESNPEDKKSQEPLAVNHIDEQLGLGKPNSAQYNPIQPFSGSTSSLLRDLVTPWTLMLFPIVQWSSFVVSWSSSCLLVLTLTQSFVFAAPPYNFSPSQVGYTNFATLGGAMLGLVTAGPLGDYLSKVMTRRNRMIREPEMRLPMLLPFIVILAIGSSIVSVGYQNAWDWKVIVILGYGCIGWQVASIPPIAITYAIDAYKPVSGEYLVSMTVNKNVWGYGVASFLIPWILKAGFIEPIMINTGLTIIFTLFGGIALYLGGKKARGWTRNSYVHKL